MLIGGEKLIVGFWIPIGVATIQGLPVSLDLNVTSSGHGWHGDIAYSFVKKTLVPLIK